MKFNSRFPYIRNFRFTVRQHIAPPPTPVLWSCCLTDKPKLEDFMNVSRIERSLRYPPLTGQFGSGILDLKLLAPLAGGPNGHTQVFTVEAQSDLERVKRGQMMVAKVYDPVFMDDEGGLFDSFHVADEHYTHEVRAYEELSEFQGGLIPKFYGSFSLDIPVTDEQTRAVRLILLEHIEGNTMEELGVQSFSQKERQRMMKAVVDFESWVYERNILLRT
ncbi:hypothetical protein TRVA0_023S00870 [Trichomonascus vanleenenianus]|uniref:uncharacterized protein n=1 Tax=Trichomonascus vanleenenianus TaxID=2268995 RepID=UPI003ECB9920